MSRNNSEQKKKPLIRNSSEMACGSKKVKKMGKSDADEAKHISISDVFEADCPGRTKVI